MKRLIVLEACSEIILSKINALCIHALSTILHYSIILAHDWCLAKLCLTTEGDKGHAYMQCLDSGKPYMNDRLFTLNVKS